MSLLLLCNHPCLQIMNIFTKMLCFYFFLDRFFFEGSPLTGRQQNKHLRKCTITSYVVSLCLSKTITKFSKHVLYPGRSLTGRLVTTGRFVFWTLCNWTFGSNWKFGITGHFVAVPII
jgi:hypothetical protein